MLRRSLDAASVLCLLLAFTCALAWLWHDTQMSFDHFGVGLGCRTLELDASEGSLRLTYTRYRTPLTDRHPLAPFITRERRREGWFLGDVREWGFVAGDIRLLKVEADYETRPELFFTRRLVQLPYWLWLVALGPAPAAWLLYRCTRVRRAKRRGFPVTSGPEG